MNLLKIITIKFHSFLYNFKHTFKFRSSRFLPPFLLVIACYIILKYYSLILPQNAGNLTHVVDLSNIVNPPNAVNIWFAIGVDFFLALLITLFVTLVEGVVDSFINDHPRANEYLKHLKRNLKILGITLYSLHKEKNIVNILTEKFNEKSNHYNFRFLLLNPCSEAIKERADIEGKDHNLLRIECAKSIKNLDIAKERVKNKIEANEGVFDYRFYDILPSHGIIITDETGWVGPFLYKKAGTATKWFQINNHQAYSQYENEFEDIWRLGDKESEEKKCLSKEELIKMYPNVWSLFLISKNIGLRAFDNVILNLTSPLFHSSH